MMMMIVMRMTWIFDDDDFDDNQDIDIANDIDDEFDSGDRSDDFFMAKLLKIVLTMIMIIFRTLISTMTTLKVHFDKLMRINTMLLAIILLLTIIQITLMKIIAISILKLKKMDV